MSQRRTSGTRSATRNPYGVEYSVGDLNFYEIQVIRFMTPSSILCHPLPFYELAK